MNLWRAVLVLLRAMFVPKSQLAIENLALRQQLAVCKQTIKRPRLRPRDRAFWACLCRCWPAWRSSLVIVQPATVVKWHRMGFRLFWRWKSKSDKVGRPCVAREIRELIRRMAQDNSTWGAPRIRAELARLGHDLAEATVAKYMGRPRNRKPPSSTWRTFLAGHAAEIAACDFFVVPTATFRLLYCFVVMSHDRRRVLHFGVTCHPTARWAAQQIVEAFPFDEAPRFLLRDNDAIYGEAFQHRVQSLGIEEVRTAYRRPWQNAYCERLIGSVRRECLNHVIVLGEQHLWRTLSAYFTYYNHHRAHQGLQGDAPVSREVEPPENGEIISIPHLGGLHHQYTRRAA